MSLAAYFYRNGVPESNNLLGMLISTLVAESDGDIDSEVCRKITGGLLDAWIGAEEAESDSDEYATEYAENPERLWIATYQRTYCNRLWGRKVTQKDIDIMNSDGVGWWPDGLNLHRRSWPKKALIKIARLMGEIEADNTQAMSRYTQREMATASES